MKISPKGIDPRLAIPEANTVKFVLFKGVTNHGEG